MEAFASGKAILTFRRAFASMADWSCLPGLHQFKACALQVELACWGAVILVKCTIASAYYFPPPPPPPAGG